MNVNNMNDNNDIMIDDDDYMNIIQQQRDDIIHHFISSSSSCCHHVIIDKIRNIIEEIVKKYPEYQHQQLYNIDHIDHNIDQVNHHHNDDDEKFNHYPKMIVKTNPTINPESFLLLLFLNYQQQQQQQQQQSYNNNIIILYDYLKYFVELYNTYPKLYYMLHIGSPFDIYDDDQTQQRSPQQLQQLSSSSSNNNTVLHYAAMILLYEDTPTCDGTHRTKCSHNDDDDGDVDDEFYMKKQMTIFGMLFQLRHVKPTICTTKASAKTTTIGTTTSTIDESIKMQNNSINIIEKAFKYATILNDHHDTPIHMAAAYGNVHFIRSWYNTIWNEIVNLEQQNQNNKNKNKNMKKYHLLVRSMIKQCKDQIKFILFDNMNHNQHNCLLLAYIDGHVNVIQFLLYEIDSSCIDITHDTMKACQIIIQRIDKWILFRQNHIQSPDNPITSTTTICTVKEDNLLWKEQQTTKRIRNDSTIITASNAEVVEEDNKNNNGNSNDNNNYDYIIQKPMTKNNTYNDETKNQKQQQDKDSLDKCYNVKRCYQLIKEFYDIQCNQLAEQLLLEEEDKEKNHSVRNKTSTITTTMSKVVSKKKKKKNSSSTNMNITNMKTKHRNNHINNIDDNNNNCHQIRSSSATILNAKQQQDQQRQQQQNQLQGTTSNSEMITVLTTNDEKCIGNDQSEINDTLNESKGLISHCRIKNDDDHHNNDNISYTCNTMIVTEVIQSSTKVGNDEDIVTDTNRSNDNNDCNGLSLTVNSMTSSSSSVKLLLQQKSLSSTSTSSSSVTDTITVASDLNDDEKDIVIVSKKSTNSEHNADDDTAFMIECTTRSNDDDKTTRNYSKNANEIHEMNHKLLESQEANVLDDKISVVAQEIHEECLDDISSENDIIFPLEQSEITHTRSNDNDSTGNIACIHESNDLSLLSKNVANSVAEKDLRAYSSNPQSKATHHDGLINRMEHSLLCNRKSNMNSNHDDDHHVLKASPNDMFRQRLKAMLQDKYGCAILPSAVLNSIINPTKSSNNNEEDENHPIHNNIDNSNRSILQYDRAIEGTTDNEKCNRNNDISSVDCNSSNIILEDNDEYDALIESLCLDVTMIFDTPYSMALKSSPCQLDIMEQLLNQQINAIHIARQIQQKKTLYSTT